jgi:hypothetical protein
MGKFEKVSFYHYGLASDNRRLSLYAANGRLELDCFTLQAKKYLKASYLAAQSTLSGFFPLRIAPARLLFRFFNENRKKTP